MLHALYPTSHYGIGPLGEDWGKRYADIFMGNASATGLSAMGEVLQFLAERARVRQKEEVYGKYDNIVLTESEGSPKRITQLLAERLPVKYNDVGHASGGSRAQDKEVLQVGDDVRAAVTIEYAGGRVVRKGSMGVVVATAPGTGVKWHGFPDLTNAMVKISQVEKVLAKDADHEEASGRRRLRADGKQLSEEAEQRSEQVAVAAAVVEGKDVKWIGFAGGDFGGDEYSIFRVHRDWLAHRTKRQYVSQWSRAGLSLSDGQQAAANSSDFFSRCLFDVASAHVRKSSDELRVEASLTPEDRARVEAEGFWPVAQAIVRAELPDMGPKPSKEVILAGHSLGGFHAAAASMWLEKVDGRKYKTYSMSGTGTQCAARRFSMGSATGLMEYLDPDSTHSQITTYVHPLDMYAGMDYQPGRVCTYGTQALNSGRPAHHLIKSICGKLVGHSFPEAFVASKLNKLLGVQAFSEDAYRAAQECMYWSHSLAYAWLLMQDEAVLHTNGLTDGGCKDPEVMGPEACPGSGKELACSATLGGIGLLTVAVSVPLFCMGGLCIMGPLCGVIICCCHFSPWYVRQSAGPTGVFASSSDKASFPEFMTSGTRVSSPRASRTLERQFFVE